MNAIVVDLGCCNEKAAQLVVEVMNRKYPRYKFFAEEYTLSVSSHKHHCLTVNLSTRDDIEREMQDFAFGALAGILRTLKIS